jgi:hypothetical protein
MSKITLASSSEVWLINLPGEQFNHFLSNDMEGLGLTGCLEVFQESIARERDASTIRRKHYEKLGELDYGDPVTLEAFPITRAQHRADTSVSTPAANNIITGERDISGQETRTITPILDNNRLKWANVPKQFIPELQDISLWIGHQLNHKKRMPKEFKDVPPNGKLISIKGHPEGLLAIPNVDGSPRSIVPRSQILALVLQTHEDIHHQSHVKVLYMLNHCFIGRG